MSTDFQNPRASARGAVNDQNQSPWSCRSPLCGYLIQHPSRQDCAHNMEFVSPCAWHRTPEQIRAMHERDQAMASAARQPMQRRGL